MLVAQNSLGSVCPVPLTVRGKASDAVAQLLNHNYRRRAVVLLFGRVFLDREFLPGEKVRSLLATLLSSHTCSMNGTLY